MSVSGQQVAESELVRDRHPDAPLWTAVCADDATAIQELFVNRCGTLFQFLSRKFGWDDLQGELYLHLREDNWRRLGTWKGNSSLKTWIQTVAQRLCWRRMKEDRRFVPLEEQHDFRASMNDATEQDGLFVESDVLKAMATLKSDQERRFLVLHTLQGLPIAEVARLMGISRSNADVIKHRAIHSMRRRLGLDGGADA